MTLKPDPTTAGYDNTIDGVPVNIVQGDNDVWLYDLTIAAGQTTVIASGQELSVGNLILAGATPPLAGARLINMGYLRCISFGFGKSTAPAVTFTASTSMVNLVAHGMANGTKVYFPIIVTTTGISANTAYYVVNAVTDAFQVASSIDGTPLTLTNDGTGTVTTDHPRYIAGAGSVKEVYSMY